MKQPTPSVPVVPRPKLHVATIKHDNTLQEIESELRAAAEKLEKMRRRKI